MPGPEEVLFGLVQQVRNDIVCLRINIITVLRTCLANCTNTPYAHYQGTACVLFVETHCKNNLMVTSIACIVGVITSRMCGELSNDMFACLIK